MVIEDSPVILKISGLNLDASCSLANKLPTLFSAQDLVMIVNSSYRHINDPVAGAKQRKALHTHPASLMLVYHNNHIYINQ